MKNIKAPLLFYKIQLDSKVNGSSDQKKEMILWILL
jgi:hypothetical protein